MLLIVVKCCVCKADPAALVGELVLELGVAIVDLFDSSSGCTAVRQIDASDTGFTLDTQHTRLLQRTDRLSVPHSVKFRSEGVKRS